MNLINQLKFFVLRKNMKNANVKGLISKNEARFLFENSIKSFFYTVEIGSFQGYSTLMLAYGSKIGKRFPITAIDPHLGLILDGKKVETYDIFLKNIEKFNLKLNVHIERMTSANASKKWNHPISFLWIDGDHDYDAVKLDYTLWEPHLVKGGIIAFHDAGLKTFWPGPRKLVDEIELTKKFKPFQYVEGIAWTVKK